MTQNINTKSKVYIRIKQAIIIFFICFLFISFLVKISGGSDGGTLWNPYDSPMPRPITWGKFYLMIPKNLLGALIGTIFILAPCWYEDIKTKNDKKKKSEEQITP